MANVSARLKRVLHMALNAPQPVVAEMTDILDAVDLLSATEAGFLDGVTAGTSAASKALVLDASSKINAIDVTTLTIGGTAVGATAAELNAAADVSVRLVEIADAATYTLLVADSGKIHLIPDLSQDIVVTLPAEADGMDYTFLYKGIAEDVSDWQFDSGSNTNYFVGGLMFADTDAGSAGDEIVSAAGDGNSNSKVNILRPNVGTTVRLTCDGTLWVLSGFVNSITVPTFADQ